MSFNHLIKLAVFVTSTISLCISLAHGEGNTAQQLQDEAKQYSESMPTGSVPATNILGIADSNVPRVNNFKSIVSQFTQGLGADGKIKNALGFEVVPYLLANDTLDWKAYDSSQMIQMLTRTSVSFAAFPASDGKTASSAFGAQTVFYSEATNNARNEWGTTPECSNNLSRVSSNYLDFISKMGNKFPQGLKIQPGAQPTFDETLLKGQDRTDYDQAKKDFEAAPKKCQDKINITLQVWNASIIAGGLGWGFYSADNNAQTLKISSSVFWFTGAYGWGDGTSNTNSAGLLTLHIRKAADERTPDPANANALLSGDTTLYGANLRYGSRKFGGLMEFSSKKGTLSGLPDENVRRCFLGIDAKMAEDIYLSFGVGSETGRRDGVNRKFALTNIKYAFGSKPIFIKGE